MEDQKEIKQEEQETNVDYIEAINELKRKSVDKEKYDALRAENKKLIESIVNGQSVEVEAQPINKRSAKDIRNELFNTAELSNLEYVEKALELRDAVLEEKGVDIFVGAGHKLNPSQEDYETANRVAETFKQCIDYAQGDSEVFTNELMRKTNDVKLPFRR